MLGVASARTKMIAAGPTKHARPAASIDTMSSCLGYAIDLSASEKGLRKPLMLLRMPPPMAKPLFGGQ